MSNIRNISAKAVMFTPTASELKAIKDFDATKHSSVVIIAKSLDNYDAIIEAIELGEYELYITKNVWDNKLSLGVSPNVISANKKLALQAKFAEDLGVSATVVQTIVQETARIGGYQASQPKSRVKKQETPEPNMAGNLP